MYLTQILSGILPILFLLNRIQATPIRPLNEEQELASTALQNAYKVLNGSLSDGTKHSTCTKAKLIERKEYGDLTIPEQDDFIRAVLCLQSLPSTVNRTQFPGARTRYDDFVIVHANYTPNIHMTANFYHWHRVYIWSFELALRDECKYKGYLPYWNWSKYPNPFASPIFNGDAHSLGGNGEKLPHTGGVLPPNVVVPAGDGGGCVKTGPFANMTVNVGPLKTLSELYPLNKHPEGYAYNPRCLQRDMTDMYTKGFARPSDIAKHITSSKDILAFQDTLQLDLTNGTTTWWPLHFVAHYTVGGDPGSDIFYSPGDPAFWLTHGMVDRHWWVWQNQSPANRTLQYQGVTVMLEDGSPPGKIDDVQYMNEITPKGYGQMTSRELVSTTSGPFCYVYV